jgi:hypothetical protein
MEQRGVDGPRVAMRDRRGAALTFGHYVLRERGEEVFSRGWSGRHFLDYGSARNAALDVARFGYTPLVAVNEGDSTLLLGWEIFRVAGVQLPLPLYWALRDEGELEEVV